MTIDCSSGENGIVYHGRIEIETRTISLDSIPDTRTEIMMNLASPDSAFRWASLPTDGIGLARVEFIINNTIKVHFYSAPESIRFPSIPTRWFPPVNGLRRLSEASASDPPVRDCL